MPMKNNCFGEGRRDTMSFSKIKVTCRVPAQVNKVWSYSPGSCGHFSRTNFYFINTYRNIWHLAAYKLMKCKDLFTVLPEATSEAHYAEAPENTSLAARNSLISTETRRCKETRTVYFLLFI